LEPVVVTSSVAVALVLIRALRPGITAVGVGRDVVWLTSTAAITRIGVVALARRRIPAGGPRRLEAVVVTDPGEAGVLVDALGAGVAAVGAIRLVVGLADAAAVAGIG